ncbi:MAG: transcription antitermination factor NusB [Planctomycetota bacterium]
MRKITSKYILRQIFGIVMSYMYQYEITKKKNTDLYVFYKGLYMNFAKRNFLSKELLEFTQSIIDHTKNNLEIVDKAFSKYMNSDLSQKTSIVDFTILRVGTSLILFFTPQINPVLVINIAVEISKKYSGENSYRFINAVLDKVYKEHYPPLFQQEEFNIEPQPSNDSPSTSLNSQE